LGSVRQSDAALTEQHGIRVVAETNRMNNGWLFDILSACLRGNPNRMDCES
jgi:hypothetical protein